MKSICVIPAKGTSNRLPHKNIKPFLGKPVIEYTIEAALESGVFDRVVVSTDDLDISDIAQNAGVLGYIRSPETCVDDAPMIDAVVEILMDYPADYVCMAYACSPFITADLLREADAIVKGGEFDCVYPIYRAEPIERAQVIVDGKLMSRFPIYDNVNSQGFPDTYHSAGQFYYCDAKKVMEHRTVMLARRWGIIVPEAVDIDTAEDWEKAERMYRNA